MSKYRTRGILCNDCGHIMSRYLSHCLNCRHTNLSFYSDLNSEELHTASRRIKRTREPGHPAAGLLAVASVVAVGCAIYFFANPGTYSDSKSKEAQQITAALAASAN